MGTQFQRTEAINAPDESDRFLLYGAGVAKPSFPSFFFLFLFFETSSSFCSVVACFIFFSNNDKPTQRNNDTLPPSSFADET